ncbi:sodium:solute symporter family protein [Crassaminicella thermophila]|uniref:Sodium:solute symporter family protein n=1 Tax=Crassaminicella thermophila TaxID=2599308 RepID=A0A5C0SIA1_CRATE|nr:sodium:solute symporter family protein [Crassaminicella thermophila]QEK12928.1 sodium:solute symporter family protein [Crassaminicella thermophila]
MNQNILALLIIGTYMFIPLWIGSKAGERELQTPEDFFVQSRAMESIAVFFTVQATWWSAFAFLGSNAYFYSKGPVYWTTIAWDFLFGILFFIVGKRIWFYGKINNYITASDFFRDMYDSEKLGNLITFIMLLFTMPYLQIQLAGGAYLIEVASQGLIPWKMGCLIFCIVIVIYVWTGGLRAVAWVDIFYEILILFGIILAGFFIVSKVGGISSLFESLRQVAPETLTLPGPTGAAGPMLWISMFLIVPMGAIMGPPLWTRIYAVKSPIFFNLMPFLLGFIAIVNIAPMLVGNAGILLEPNIQNADALLPIMLLKYAPFALASLILTGGAAAAMSTSNSQIHSLSAIYAIDIHKKYINKNINNKSLIRIARWSILIFTTFSYLMTIWIPGLLVQIGMVALSGTAQVIVPTIGVLFWRKSTAQGAIAGLLSGVIFLGIFTIFHSHFPIDPGFISLLINTIVFIFVSSITPNRNQTILDRFDKQNKIFNHYY